MTDTLKINGQTKEFPEGEFPGTLAVLLDRMAIDQATVVAEVDGNIVERKKFAETKIETGQSIELIRFVGGG